MAGAGGATFNVPDSAGVPEELANLTLVARYNDLDDVRAQMKDHAGEVAAISVEPTQAEGGDNPIRPAFLEAGRSLADENDALFIVDDPIFSGLAISLLFGILVSTLLTLVVIPVLYYALYRQRNEVPTPNQP